MCCIDQLPVWQMVRRTVQVPGCFLTRALLCVQEWARRRRPVIPCIEATKPVSSTHWWSPALRFYHLLLTTTCSASIMLTIFYW